MRDAPLAHRRARARLVRVRDHRQHQQPDLLRQHRRRHRLHLRAGGNVRDPRAARRGGLGRGARRLGRDEPHPVGDVELGGQHDDVRARGRAAETSRITSRRVSSAIGRREPDHREQPDDEHASTTCATPGRPRRWSWADGADRHPDPDSTAPPSPVPTPALSLSLTARASIASATRPSTAYHFNSASGITCSRTRPAQPRQSARPERPHRRRGGHVGCGVVASIHAGCLQVRAIHESGATNKWSERTATASTPHELRGVHDHRSAHAPTSTPMPTPYRTCSSSASPRAAHANDGTTRAAPFASTREAVSQAPLNTTIYALNGTYQNNNTNSGFNNGVAVTINVRVTLAPILVRRCASNLTDRGDQLLERRTSRDHRVRGRRPKRANHVRRGLRRSSASPAPFRLRHCRGSGSECAQRRAASSFRTAPNIHFSAQPTVHIHHNVVHDWPNSGTR